MASSATKRDYMAPYGLTLQQFNTAIEVAKIKLAAKSENLDGRFSNKDLITWVGLDKDPTIITKIKAGHPAREVTEHLLRFINEHAPEELPGKTRRIVEEWNKTGRFKNGRG